ncbi:MAG TPA: ExeM/NucH family extracellular endonuclease [Pyrinomonadaceae bacterium]|nr:ExeM/NucH family extracellular endonuclease [Pyrinomonadaceae bacterium]
MSSSPLRRRISIRTLRQFFALFVIAALVYSITPLQGFIQTTPSVEAASTDLFFSEYIEGSSNNKALEIYNATGAPINLGTNGYNVQMFFNGSATAGLTINLVGTVANGDVFVLAQSAANATILAQADQTNNAGWFNGDDAVVLRKGTTIIDSIGQVGFDPGTEWGTGVNSTADNTIRRKANVCGGDTNATDVFDPTTQWDGFATDDATNLGSHLSNCLAETAPAVTTTSPANGDTDVSISSNIVINFNEPVNVSGNWYTISCTSSNLHTANATANGAGTTFTLNPDTDFAFNETCTVTVKGNQVSDQDLNDPPEFMTGDYTWSFQTGADPCTSPTTSISAVQGSGNASPMTGSTRTVRGTVVGDFQGAASFNGFYLQEPVGDGDLTTSDGIFIFAPSSADVAVGDDVVVKGTVTEFNGLTEINSSNVTRCGVGSAIAPTVVDLPETVEGELERYEGMLVTIPETLTVSEVFNLGRFGEVMLSSDGRMFQPTNSNPPNSPGAIAEANANLRRKILLDDGQSPQNPNPIPYLGPDNTLRAGDTVDNLTGILDFRFSEYRMQPTVAPSFSYVNARTPAPSPVGGNVKVAGLNVLNYFNGNGSGLDGAAGGFPTARGANNLTEFNRQRAKIIAAITAIDADVFGLSEVENDGGGATSAIQDLVNGLNAATAPGTYAFRLGLTPGTDLIMNAIIYKPSRVTPIGAAVNDVDGAWAQARNPLAQTFSYNANGEKFTFIINHFTSKGCSGSDTGLDADQGDGQGCDNFTRTQQAQRLLTFISDRQAAAGDPDVLVMGDLNAYGKEDPINILTAGGLENQIERFIENPYSYIFDAQSGYLDHALTTPSLSNQVSGVTEWHINADEPLVLDYNTEFKTQDLYAPTPYRASDHDPVVVGLDLNAPVEIQTLTASPNPATVNGAVNFSATFTDADASDTHTATWQWGDSTSSAGTVSGNSVNDSHTYTAVGTYTATLTVTDSHNNTDMATVQVVVGYGVNPQYDQTKAHKSGSTIPIKLQLVDAAGNNVSGPGLVVHVTGVTLGATPVPGTDYDSGNANPGNNFRFTGDGYIFNLSTKTLNLGPGEYTLHFTVTGDPVEHTLKFIVR